MLIGAHLPSRIVPAPLGMDGIVGAIEIQRTNQRPWKVAFDLTTTYFLSNSLISKLGEDLANPSHRTNLAYQLQMIRSGNFPTERVEVREGAIRVFGEGVSIENTLISVSGARPGEMLVSNNFEVSTRTLYVRQYSYGGDRARFVPGEVEMRSKPPKSLGLPHPIVPAAFENLLLSLTNVAIAAAANGLLTLSGDAIGEKRSGHWEILLDPQCNLFPRRISAVQCDGSRATWDAEPAYRDGLGWVPENAEMQVQSASGADLYKELWRFSNYGSTYRSPASLGKIDVPLNYIVNEYRYSNAFAYIMGYRSPTASELLRMSTNRDAILMYQRLSHSHRTVLNQSRSGRIIAACVVLGLLCLPALSYLWNRATSFRHIPR